MNNNNNGDTGAEFYDVGDISDVKINKSFLQEGSSIIYSITSMVATIIPVCSSSLLQDDTSVVHSFNLNYSPNNVPSSILDHVSTNSTIHQCFI